MAEIASACSGTGPIPEIRRGHLALLLLPGALTLYLGFEAGGFFVGSTGLAAVVVLVALVLRVTLADRPLAGFSGSLAVAGAGLGAFALFVLLSALWSDSPARALAEFDRALLYLGTLVLLGSMPRTAANVSVVLRGVGAALFVVSMAGLLSRLFPDAFGVDSPIAQERLSHPLTYWNAVGLAAALAMVIALHLASSEREPPWARLAGAAALPLLASCLYLTLSRGAIAALAVGILVYLLVARPWGAVGGLAAALPSVAAAVVASYRAEELNGADPSGPAAIDQGHELALVLAACSLGAVLVRALALPLDRRLGAVRISRDARRRGALGLLACLAGAALVAVVILDVPQRLERQYERFVEGTRIGTGEDPRTRLTNPGNNGRIDQWGMALDGFAERPVAGEGAGTFAVLAARERPTNEKVEDAHSLYLETLDELGVVGLVLLLTALLAVLVRFARLARPPHRHLYAALLALGVMWALHAGVDWDWEMPAITLWLFALGGIALAAEPERALSWRPGRLTRVLLGLACLLLALTPGLMAVSQARLNGAVAAFDRGDCSAAIDAALDSVDAMPVRPQPFEVLGWCDARLGLYRLGQRAFRSAIERDPENWELHYGLAVVRAADGRDPRPQARRALELNPRESRTRWAARAFDSGDPRKWKRRALRARLTIG